MRGHKRNKGAAFFVHVKRISEKQTVAVMKRVRKHGDMAAHIRHCAQLKARVYARHPGFTGREYAAFYGVPLNNWRAFTSDYGLLNAELAAKVERMLNEEDRA